MSDQSCLHSCLYILYKNTKRLIMIKVALYFFHILPLEYVGYVVYLMLPFYSCDIVFQDCYHLRYSSLRCKWGWDMAHVNALPSQRGCYQINSEFKEICNSCMLSNDALPSLLLVILNCDNAALDDSVASLIYWHCSHFKWGNSESSTAQWRVKHVVCNYATITNTALKLWGTFCQSLINKMLRLTVGDA